MGFLDLFTQIFKGMGQGAGERGPKLGAGGFPLAPAPSDPAAPYLFADVYRGEGPQPDWRPAAKVLSGIIIKCSQGSKYAYESWFLRNWGRVREAGAERYERGEFLRGCYHYLELTRPAAPQADYYLRCVDRAGGWGKSDIVPIVDVEGGGEDAPNRRASKAQVVDCVSTWAERIKAITGRNTMLYGRGLMRDLAIDSKMGCTMSWNASYTERMVTNGLTQVKGKDGPWELDEIAMWQYSDGTVQAAAKTGLPIEIPDGPGGLSSVDMNVAITGTERPVWWRVRERLLAGVP